MRSVRAKCCHERRCEINKDDIVTKGDLKSIMTIIMSSRKKSIKTICRQGRRCEVRKFDMSSGKEMRRQKVRYVLAEARWYSRELFDISGA